MVVNIEERAAGLYLLGLTMPPSVPAPGGPKIEPPKLDLPSPAITLPPAEPPKEPKD